jgi:hypothetical protein
VDNDQTGIGVDVPGPSVAVRITGIEDLTVTYSNLMTSNFDQQAFQVVFAQLLPPIVMSPEDEQELLQRGFVEAKAVAQLVLTPTMMEQTIQVLTNQLERFKQQVANASQGQSND